MLECVCSWCAVITSGTSVSEAKHFLLQIRRFAGKVRLRYFASFCSIFSFSFQITWKKAFVEHCGGQYENVHWRISEQFVRLCPFQLIGPRLFESCMTSCLLAMCIVVSGSGNLRALQVFSILVSFRKQI